MLKHEDDNVRSDHEKKSGCSFKPLF